jgi:hypothetical protein
MNTKLASVVVAVCVVGAALGGLDSVRVYSARPDVFEYLLASIAAGSDTATPQLAFNNLRTGRTTFAKVGEMVGDYRVQSFTPRTTTVFNERTGKDETVKSGTAVLSDRYGQKVTLDMGKALPADGFVAWLVDTESGNGVQVRPGDTPVFAGAAQRVDGVSSNSVRVSVNGEPRFLTPATEPERAALSALWEKQRAAWEESKRRADERARKETEAREQEAIRAAFESTALYGAQPPAPTVKRPASTQISVATEYRYPTDYEIIPPLYDSKGNMIRPLLVIPRNFVTRPVGVTFGVGATAVPVPQGSQVDGGPASTTSGAR